MKKFGVFLLTLLFSLMIVNNTLGYVIEAVSFDNGAVVTVEVARTPEELELGLMFRESLRENAGMLFVMGSEDKHSFWMKNMNLPLDIIWVGSNQRVVDITENVLPCREDPCPAYSPSNAARYVLEVPAGFAQRNGISKGQEADFIRYTSLQ